MRGLAAQSNAEPFLPNLAQPIQGHDAIAFLNRFQRPVVPLGGAATIDLALNYPDGVEQLILVDSVGFSGSFPFGQYLDASLLYWGANGLRFRKEIALQVLQMLPLVDPSLKDKVLFAPLHQFHYRKHREPHYGCPDSGTAEITMILPCSMSAST